MDCKKQNNKKTNDCYCKQYGLWLEKTKNNKELNDEIVKMDDKEKEDAFFEEIAFGTGGLRGKIGAGTNRLNEYTVGRVTFGIADYMLKNNLPKKITVAYDSRRKSKDFAFLAAKIVSSFGICAEVFGYPSSTPLLSFAVRNNKSGMGIVITASHNPKEYNGYKVYNNKGCQITDAVANEITNYIKNHGYFEEYNENKDLITVLNENVLNAFIGEIMNYSLFCDKIFYPSVIYTPLNGTGRKPIEKLFEKMGVKNYLTVPEQAEPDGEFPTCPKPNPEEKTALDLAVKLAKKECAELVIATDPDADRVGVAYRENGEYVFLNGNETGILLENYILEYKTSRGLMPENPYIVKTIVTTDMAEKIALDYGVKTYEVLTGFKYIGETIDAIKNGNYIFGMEESFGYLEGKHVRDKDSVSAVMTVIQAFAYYKSLGLSLRGVLNNLYKKYGYYKTSLLAKTYEGKSGTKYIEEFMNENRNCPRKEFCGRKIIKYTDYSNGINGLPKSNVLKFVGENFSIVMRPSGTEPKIKFYFSADCLTECESNELLGELTASIKALLR